MSIVKINMKGLEDVRRELMKLEVNVRNKAIVNATSKASQALAKELKSVLKSRKTVSAPGESPGVDSGNLAGSVDWKNWRGTRNKGVSKGIVGHRKDKGAKHIGTHAALLEFGTENMAARPYFYPTFMRMLQKLKAIMYGELEKSLYGS